MNYYRKKAEAFKRIDEMVKDKVPVEVIIYKIATLYGFGQKIVEERFKQLEAMRDNEPKKD